MKKETMKKGRDFGGDSGLGFHKEWSDIWEYKFKHIVHCPTKEDFKRVLKWLEENTKLTGAPPSDCWNNSNTSICIASDIGYSSHNYFEEEIIYNDYTFCTAEEFLEEFGGEASVPTALETMAKQSDNYGSGLIKTLYKPNKLKEKTMSVIKNAFKSKDKKALDQYGLRDSNGGLSEDGRIEFINFLWEKMPKEKKEFIQMIVKQYEEEKK